jgi:hypothetical protein
MAGVGIFSHEQPVQATGITLDALNSCARGTRRFVIHPPQPAPPTPEPIRVADLHAGQEGWIYGVYSDHGHLLINDKEEVTQARGPHNSTLIRITERGVLVSCTPRPTVVIWDEDPSFHSESYAPIIGTFNPAQDRGKP